jgi:ABC-type iron transport system FetAB ATPase subunit
MTATHQLDVVGLSVGSVGPLDFFLATGECLTLAGASGAGKTRVLRAIADLDAHQGEVFCRGSRAADLKPSLWRRRVGMLAADSQWWRDRVDEHFPAAPPPAHLQALHLAPGLLGEPVARLSSGERQRLALLRLLANRPEVLLLDEPTANLDPDNVSRVEQLVADYRAAEGAAVVWVSHDAAQSLRVAERHVRLESGRLSADAPGQGPVGGSP